MARDTVKSPASGSDYSTLSKLAASPTKASSENEFSTQLCRRSEFRSVFLALGHERICNPWVRRTPPCQFTIRKKSLMALVTASACDRMG